MLRLGMALGAYLLIAAGACGDPGTSSEQPPPAVQGPPRGGSGPAAEPMGPIDAGAGVAGTEAPRGADAGATPPGDAAAAAHGDAAIEHDGGIDGGGPPAIAQREARALEAAPSYLGSVDNSAACSQRYPTLGFEPIGQPGERFPLFLYFVGTAFVQPDASASHDGAAAVAVSRAMARRGFVALSVAYDNSALAWLSDHEAQLSCLFAADSADSALSAACALPQVDCDQGIATWGHSQGALVAVMAARFDPRVRAAWLTGFGGDARSPLAHDRLRVVNGEADATNGTPEVLNTIAGSTAADCPNADSCLRQDGSGWIIVRKRELADPAASSADHCWFDKRTCLDSAIVLEPSWVDPSSTRAYALEPNADWLARTARRR
jgi:hypothetical protein